MPSAARKRPRAICPAGHGKNSRGLGDPQPSSHTLDDDVDDDDDDDDEEDGRRFNDCKAYRASGIYSLVPRETAPRIVSVGSALLPTTARCPTPRTLGGSERRRKCRRDPGGNVRPS